MDMEIEISDDYDFQIGQDYFTADGRCFIKVLSVSEKMVAGQCYIRDPIRKEFFPCPHGVMMPREDLGQFFEEYDDDLDETEEEIEMPYIKDEDRTIPVRSDVDLCREEIAAALGESARNAGDFNYMISMAISIYLRKNGLNYANCNEMVGMLECCKAEFQRRVVDVYEEEKLEENGDCGYTELLVEAGILEYTDED